MNYFVANKFEINVTGIEKAMFYRLKLFKKYNILAKIIFAAHNTKIKELAELYQLSEMDIFTFYDYIQESINYKSYYYFDWISYWERECGYTLKYVKNTKDIKVYEEGKYRLYVHFLDEEYKKIDYINHFDVAQRKIKRDLYDSRGFLSCTKILTTDQKVITEFYYSPTGEVKLEKYYSPFETGEKVQRIIYRHNDKITYFDNDAELYAFCIEKIYRPKDLFIADKNIALAPAFNLANPNIPVISVIHSTHEKENEKVLDSPIKKHYKELFKNLKRYSALIVSTDLQNKEISQRINNEIPVVTIPVGYVKEEFNYNINNPEQKVYKLISVARYSPEKQLEHQILLINRLRKEFPNVQLHLFGFGKEIAKYQKLIKELNLENHVFLRGYLTDLKNEFKSAYLSLITSNMEGFNLGLLESISFGIPIVSYNSKYGPSELVINNINGFLIKKNDQEELYIKTRLLLKDKKLRDKFSNMSIEHSRNYLEKNIIDGWKKILI